MYVTLSITRWPKNLLTRGLKKKTAQNVRSSVYGKFVF